MGHESSPIGCRLQRVVMLPPGSLFTASSSIHSVPLVESPPPSRVSKVLFDGLKHGRRDQLAHAIARLARSRRHEDHREFLLRIDPEIGPAATTPVKVPGRSHDAARESPTLAGFADVSAGSAADRKVTAVAVERTTSTPR